MEVLHMRKVNLTMKEQTKYEIVKRFVDNKCTNYKNLALQLNSSLKTAYNLVSKYKLNGKESFSHKNHNRKPSTTYSDQFCNNIISIYEKIDCDVNFRHFRVILKRDYNINVSCNFLYRLFEKLGFISPKARKNTKTAYRQRIKFKSANKQNLTKSEQIIVANHLLDDVDSHPRKERSKYFGEQIQMNASIHLWFGNFKSTLHAAIDDATGMIVGAYFDTQETPFGYYHITKQFLEKYGIPTQILNDNRTVFNYQKHGKSSEERNTFTQYGFMCHRLGICLTTSSIPQVKGRIERLFQTLQSRLVVELSLNNINNIVDTNCYLPQFIDMFNNEFSLPYNDTINAFEYLQENQNINEFLTIVSHRKVDNGCTIKYNNSYYKIYNQNGKPLNIKPKSECLVVKTFDDKYFVIFDSTQYFMEKLETHRKDSILEPKIEKEKKAYSPAWNHPWRKAFYENYLKYYRTNQQNNYAYNYE